MEDVKDMISTPALISLPESVLARIVQAVDPDSRRQLRLTSRALRPLVDACATSLILSSYSLPCLAARGRLPYFAPGLRSVLLALQDTTAPVGFLAKLPHLGLHQLPHLTSLTLALANDHQLPSSSIADLAAAVPPSATRLVLTHMLGSEGGRTASHGSSPLAAAVTLHHQLDYSALRHLLLLCPHVREVRLEGGCWVRSGADLQALAALTSRPVDAAAAAAVAAAAVAAVPASTTALTAAEAGDAAAASVRSVLSQVLGEGRSSSGWCGSGTGGGGSDVVISCIRGMYVDASDDCLKLPMVLGSLNGLAALDVQLVSTTIRQAPAVAAAADGFMDAELGGLLAEMEAILNLAYQSVASEQLLRSLAMPALAGLTRLVVRDFQGCTTGLLGALTGLPLLAHLGLSGLDDAPYITDEHLELLACLPSLRHLAVDRLDIAQQRGQQPPLRPPLPPPRQQQQQQSGPYGVPPGGGAYSWGETAGGSGCNSSSSSSGPSSAILPGLTGLEVALVVHSVPRLPHAFPSVQHLTLRWLWEQAMRKLAGWTSLTRLSLANLDCCLDWGLMRTLTGLTELQLCRGSSYEQLAELLYMLRALPGLQVLRLSSWHSMRFSEPDRMALGLTRGLGAAVRAGMVAGSGGSGDEQQQQQLIVSTSVASAPFSPCTRPVPATTTTAAIAGCSSSNGSGGRGVSAAVAGAFAAMDPDLHRAWGRIRAATDATAAAGAAMALLRVLPRLRSLELMDCGYPLLRCLSSRALIEDGGPLTGLRELRLSQLMDVVGSDIEEAVAALPGLRRLAVQGCWPLDGEVLLQFEGLRRAGVDVTWRR